MTMENKRPTRIEINCMTGEQKEIELTDEEIAQREEMFVKHEKEMAEQKAAEEARVLIKASALAKLSALGLTEEEAKAIAG